MDKIKNMEEIKEIISNNQMSLLFIKTVQCGVCDAVLAQTEDVLKRLPKIGSILVSLKKHRKFLVNIWFSLPLH